MQIQNQTNINFKAYPRARYKLPNGEQINILEIGIKDLPFIQKLTNNMETFMDNREIEKVTDKRLIINAAFNVIKEMLERIESLGEKNKKTRMFIAECNSDICGVLVGGLPKKTPTGEIIHSSRDGATKTETELNWLATWTSDAKTKRKGVGKILMGEYMDTVEEDGFKKIFIQSEIPSLSFAQRFYESLGFKAICKEIKHSLVEKNKDIIHCVEDLYDYKIVPMLGSTKFTNKIKEELFDKFERTISKDKPINLEDKFKTI